MDFIIRRSGISKVKDLSEVNLNSLSRYLSPEKLATIKLSRRLNTPCPDILDCVTINNTFKKIKNSTSKEIRSGRMPKEPLTTFKIGTTITISESLTLFYQISKLSNTKHGNSLLRALHGDLYTKEKLNRFGLIESPQCPRCDQVETLRHKLLECDYVKRIWKEVNTRFSRPLSQDIARDLLTIPSSENNLAELTVHAEIIQRKMSLVDDQDFLIHPKVMLNLSLRHLIRREGNEKIKTKLRDLLE